MKEPRASLFVAETVVFVRALATAFAPLTVHPEEAESTMLAAKQTYRHRVIEQKEAAAQSPSSELMSAQLVLPQRSYSKQPEEFDSTTVIRVRHSARLRIPRGLKGELQEPLSVRPS